MNTTKKDQPYTSKLKGVAALLGESAYPIEDAVLSPQTVAITSIKLSSSQPRRYFDPEKLEQLVHSVKEHGILEPLLVRPLDIGEYELVAGERRYRAAMKAELTEVPVVVRKLSDNEALQLSLVENLVREDLNPVEETEGILLLLSLKLNQNVGEVVSLLYKMQNSAKGKVTQNVLGSEDSTKIIAMFDALGLISWESFVSSRLPLLKLPEDILNALRRGEIEYTKAIAIARVKDSEEQIALLKAALTENLSLTQINERIKASRQVKGQQNSLLTRYKEVSSRLQKAKIWDEPKKQKALEKLLAQIEALLDEK
ncbi:ParB-like partition protein (plasmid) [Scytonema sp. HK-05]|uniref:ParB/RepB/Spo0J family partition protein n=1 Tax=Scytonema sp. HK-05 TaxID=1137095 RepID=UPI0009372D0C|nr:ParB/RepB/Spo0J family partition protein [Scytonema sp. HK-05]OKH43140.1 chromosome partitioning protein ParB [Scytonema sp. HK-05]BAY50220.1 ParB-like partition protein [Scytonema sp. HK-05]